MLSIFKSAVYVLSRMSTAVFLLSILALASVAGTVFLQNQNLTDYELTFGPFWAEVFMTLGLHQVYTAPWYLLILLVVTLSVSSCLWQNGPRFWRLLFKPKAVPLPAVLKTWPYSQTLSAAQSLALSKKLARAGLRPRWQHPATGATLYERAPWARLGYFLAHLAVLVLAIGGVLTGFMGFRGVLHLPDGEGLNAVWVPQTDGGYARALPFMIENNGFTLTTFPDGTPSSFTTALTISQNQQVLKQQVLAVNQPVHVAGHTIYQSTYGDAGSPVTLVVRDLATQTLYPFSTEVHQSVTLGDATITLTDARMHEPRQITLFDAPQSFGFRDVGPSVDLTITWPDRSPILLRAYLNHPDMLGIALAPKADGTISYAPIPLGLNIRQDAEWQVFTALQKTMAQTPQAPAQNAALLSALPALKNLDEATREAWLARSIQALEMARNLDLSLLPSLTHITPRYYSGLQIAYDPGFWWFVLGSLMLIAGVFLMVYADHWRVWLVPHAGKTLVAAQAARRQHDLEKALGFAKD